MNIAWNTGSVVDEINRENNTESELGNAEYKKAYEELVLPMLKEFKPDIIIISCGFDGAIHDPLGRSKLSPLMYAYMTNELNKICSHILVV